MFTNTLFILTIAYFLFDFSHGQSDDQVLFENDYTYIEAGNSFYKIHMTPRTWFEAKHECVKDGASFYYPENDKEAHAVMTFQNGTEPDIEWVFVGMSDLVSEGVFETIDGRSVSEVYNTWMAGEPNNYLGKEDCVQLNKKGELNDHQCSEKFPFICKKSLLSLELNLTDIKGEQTNESLRNNYTYIQELESLYKVHTVARDFADAKQACSKEGASLYYPETEVEHNVVTALQNKTKPDINWVYLGITDIRTEGVFETIDGKLLSEIYTDWKENEPNSVDDLEDCVEQDKSGKMNDCHCSRKFHFICKKTLKSIKPNYGCSIDYSVNKDTGKCYKLHTTPLKWTGAYVVCRAEQSHLAVIKNHLDAEYLAKLVESASKQKNGRYHQLNRGMYHLGFQYRFYEGWRTVKGAPMKADNDAWWDKQQPIVDERDQCGSMFYNGRLNSVDCDTKSFFICEQEVDSLFDKSKLSANMDNEEKYQ